MSSPEHDDHPSSPLRSAQESSPLREIPSSPLCPSSPIVAPQSSPLRYASSSSDCESPASKRRRGHSPSKEPLAYNPMYWPEGFKDGNASDDDNVPGPHEPLQYPQYSCEVGDEIGIAFIAEAQDIGEPPGIVSELPMNAVTSHDGGCSPDRCDSDTDSSESSSGSGSSSAKSNTSSSMASSDSNSSESVITSSSSDAASDSDSDASDGAAAPVTRKVHAHCELSEDEAVLVMMDLFKNQKLEKSTMECILQGVLKLLPNPNNMPKSKHLLFKYVTDLNTTAPPRVFYYCRECLYFQGEEPTSCNLCSCTQSNCFFQLPVADQIKNLFENHKLADIIDKYAAVRKERENDGILFDVCDGSVCKSKEKGKYDLTFLSHTDGVSISDSSDMSFWPVEHVICEVPPELRFKYVIIAGVWVDKCKPNMNCYLRPFVEELKNIFENGVVWTHPTTKLIETSRVTAPVFCVDAPVRSQLQNILSTGGKYCCNLCEQKMVALPPEPTLPGEKRKKRKRVFTFQEEPSKLRTDERMRRQGEAATEKRKQSRNVNKTESVKGVKGRSVVSELPQCDRSIMVYPEYMHLILCVVKQFMTQWFESSDACNLKVHRDKINSFLESIRVPDFITRIPRSTQCFSQWKANELRTFLLYLSVVIFSECMSEVYFQHWLLLVCALNTYLQESVSETDIVRAEILIRMFLRDFPRLYGNKHYTYYIHNLQHLGLVVRRWGPLWTNSAFPFESFNGVLTKFIHGTRRQGKELINSLRIVQGIEALKGRVQIARNSVNPSAAAPSQQNQTIWELRNNASKYKWTPSQIKLVSASNLRKPISVFKRGVLGSEVFTSKIYSRQEKRNNYTICYYQQEAALPEYGEIVLFCVDSSGETMALIQSFEIEHLRTFRHIASGIVLKHILPIKLTQREVLISLQHICSKVIRVGDYVCIRPNKHEVNL